MRANLQNWDALPVVLLIINLTQAIHALRMMCLENNFGEVVVG